MKFPLKTHPFYHPKKTAVGIYVGPESIEIVQLKKTDKGISVVKSVSKTALKTTITSNLIKELFQSEGIKETAVITTIPEESVMLRRFIMPLIPHKERQTTVRFEAKRHIPFNIDEVISNFYVIKEDRVANKMEILFVAVKKDDISTIILLLQTAGLTIERIEPSSLALIKALTVSGNLLESSPPTAIIHLLTSTDAQLVIAENGIPYIKREISFMSKDTKAEEVLLNEICLSINYYKREFPEKNIAKIIFCGLKEKPAWIDTIKSSLDIPTEQALPLKAIAGIDLPNPQLEIAIGLACLRLEKPKIQLNLLPKEFIPITHNIQKITAIGIFTAILILGTIYILQIPSVNKLKKEITLSEANKAVSPGLDLLAKSIDELNTQKTSSQQKRDILTICTKDRINWNEKLKRLAEIMPKETWITELTLGESTGIPGSRLLILKGSTYTEDPSMEIEITNNFSKLLKEDPVFMRGFKRLTLGTVKKETLKNLEIVNFDISATSN